VVWRFLCISALYLVALLLSLSVADMPPLSEPPLPAGGGAQAFEWHANSVALWLDTIIFM
jgi:hypothetical protein